MARDGRFDAWHLSTGLFMCRATDRPMMLYNRAGEDGAWRIGWIAIDPPLRRVVDRRRGPLIIPPP